MESKFLLAVLVTLTCLQGYQSKPTCEDLNCDLSCSSGLAKDINGCPVCKCKCPERACPPVQCLYGLKLDFNNCPTCNCNPAPCPDNSKCALLCDQGYLKDENNCPKCACLPSKCPDVKCEFTCPAGNKKNSQGCDVCECRPNCSSSECSRLCVDKKKNKSKIARCGCICYN